MELNYLTKTALAAAKERISWVFDEARRDAGLFLRSGSIVARR